MDIAAYIRREAKKEGSLSAYAKKTKVSRSELHKLLAGTHENPRITTMQKLGLKIARAK